MARNLNDPNNQGGSSINQALLNQDQEMQQQQEQSTAGQQQLGTRPRVSQAGQQTAQTVTAMPQQQTAGTGTFTNLRKYIDAARPASQERIAQAATQRVMGATGAAQKGIEQAKTAFGRNVEAGSLADRQQALEQAKGIIGGATGVTYQPTQAEIENTPAERKLVPLSVGTEPPTQPLASPESPAVPTQPQQYISPEDQARFAEIINAAYQGPMSLQQAGLYQSAAEKAREAQRVVGNVQTTEGRERILRDVFGRNRDYTQGQSRLDQLLLNTSEQGVKSLQEAAQQSGNLEQAMQQAVRSTAAEAAQRRAEIEGIRGQAREAFTTARTGQEREAEEYIKSVQENWNRLPDYFKELLAETATKSPAITGTSLKGTALDRYKSLVKPESVKKSTYNLSAEEAKLLGLTPNQATFGINPEMIQASPLALGEELITKDQLSRQLALQQLSNLDVSNELKKDLMYTNLEKAGTKDILSSLDVKKLQAIQEENRKKLEADLKKLGSTKRLGGTYSQALTNAGYTPLSKADLDAKTTAASDLLRSIAQGEAYKAGTTQAIPKDYVQRIAESKSASDALGKISGGGFGLHRPSGISVEPSQAADELKNIQKALSATGGLDTVRAVEDESTKARAGALRDLLSKIYRNE